MVEVVASAHTAVLQTALRAFELLLLREIGLLPMLDAQTMTLGALEGKTRYSLVAEGGLRQAAASERNSLAGSDWLDLQRSLSTGATFADTLRACAPHAAALKRQLRSLLNYHCGVESLRTRKMMLDLQSL